MKSTWQIKGDEEERQLAIARIAREAAEVTHCAFLANKEVTDINQAINTNQRETMLTTLQKYIAKYRLFIVGTSPITKVTVFELTKEEVMCLTNVAICNQLQMMIGFIYAYHALNGACKIAFQECFTKLSRMILSVA